MQHVVLFFTLWPMLSILFAMFFIKNNLSPDVFFLRSLEVSALVLWVCYLLHITGTVDVIREALTGAIIWSCVAVIGEIALRMETDKPAKRS